MQFKRIAECSKGSILQYFRPSLSKIFVFFSIFEWTFYTGFTVPSSAIALSKKGITKAVIKLRECADWSLHFCSYATKSGFLAMSTNNRSREQMFYSHFVLVYVSVMHCTCCMKHANKLDNFTLKIHCNTITRFYCTMFARNSPLPSVFFYSLRPRQTFFSYVRDGTGLSGLNQY